MIRVVLADDQLLVRQGIRGLLALCGDIEVVGEASDGFEAVDAVLKTRPDVGLFDVRMPGATGLDAVRELRKRKVELRTILLTTFDDDAVRREAIGDGIAGFLLKDVSLEDLAEAIRAVAGGKTLVMPMPDRARQTMQEGGAFVASAEPAALTPRELEVLRLVANGMSNREIASTFGTSEGTVKNQVSSILQKLGVRDRTRAVLKAAELGFL